MKQEIITEEHSRRIALAIEELKSFVTLTGEPACVPIQFIGTVIDNAACLLTAPLNAIADEPQIFGFSEEKNWFSLIGAVHRSFLSDLHIATETALVHICTSEKLLCLLANRQ